VDLDEKNTPRIEVEMAEAVRKPAMSDVDGGFNVSTAVT